MSDLSFHLLDCAGLTLLTEWFHDAELSRRVSAPTEHWFHYVTAEAGNFAWIVYEDQQPVGLVQLDTCPDRTGSIGLTVNPRLRSRGYGRRILSAFLRQEAAQRLEKIEACIEIDNIASLRCFQASGFTAQNSKPDGDGLVTYTYIKKG